MQTLLRNYLDGSFAKMLRTFSAPKLIMQLATYISGHEGSTGVFTRHR
jgi:hypothetical protein